MELSTSVVLTTYNGMKYLEPLLESLRLQTRKIQEVLIYDDGSSDGTISFLRDYIEKYHLSEWQITVNGLNKGWKQNFRDGILDAKGDVIFPCDQDDVWEQQKIEKMTGALEHNENILLLSSDFTPIYEAGGAKVDSFKKSKPEELVFVPDDERFAVHKRPGCVMAVRKSFVNDVAEIWKAEYAHDAFLWTAATLSGGNFLMPIPLIQYRRHNGNASAGAHRTVPNQVALMKMGESIVDWYIKTNSVITAEKRKMLDGYIHWCELRKELLLQKRLFNFIRLINYHAYFRSLRQELGDLYYLVKSR